MLPNAIIIGAMKGGTTSLHYYLSLHPEIQMSAQKELNFFCDRYNWHRGLNWYESHFTGKAKIFGESSPNYTNYPNCPEVAPRMHAIVPDAKLIYIVRDPIDRMVSQYVQKYSNRLDNRPIEEALSDSTSKSYLDRSLYYMQLEQYLPYYSSSQILVVTAEDLRDRRRATLHRVFAFLEVDADFYCTQYEMQLHSSKTKRRKTPTGQWLSKTSLAKLIQKLPKGISWHIENLLYLPFSRAIASPKLCNTLRQTLIERLTEDVEKLRAFTGCDFPYWSIGKVKH
jgi:hypothetical protein